MKKIWLMLSLLVLSACGGSDTTTYTPSSVSKTGSVTVTVVDANPATPKLVALASTTGASNKLRLVFRAPNILGQTAYRRIVEIDYPVPAGGYQVSLPVGEKYSLELISCNKNIAGISKLIKYGQSVDPVTLLPKTFTITEAVDTPVTVALADIRVGFGLSWSPAAGVTVNNANLQPTYTVTAQIPTPGGNTVLRPFWNLNTQLGSDFTTLRHMGIPATVPGVQTTPAGIQASTFLSLQGEFFLDAAYLNAGENPNNFVFYYPDFNFDNPVRMPVTVSSGTVTFANISGL